MRWVLTGATGFLGQALAHRLHAEEHDVTTLGRSRAAVGEHVDWALGESVPAGVLTKGTVLAHLAWSTVPASAHADPSADVLTNVSGSSQLFREACDAGVDRILFFSSGGTVYGPSTRPSVEADALRPMGAYATSKTAAEWHLRAMAASSETPAVVLRVANPYGIGQRGMAHGAVGIFVRQILAGRPITVYGHGQHVRDYIHVDDVLSAIEKVAGTSNPWSVYNIGTGHGTSLSELVHLVELAAGRRASILYEPSRPFDLAYSVLDCTRARTDLGWEATVSLEEGVGRLVKHWSAAPL